MGKENTHKLSPPSSYSTNVDLANMLEDVVRRVIQEEINPRLDRLEKRMEKLEERMDKLEEHMTTLESRVDKIESYLDEFRKEVRDMRHLFWFGGSDMKHTQLEIERRVTTLKEKLLAS